MNGLHSTSGIWRHLLPATAAAAAAYLAACLLQGSILAGFLCALAVLAGGISHFSAQRLRREVAAARAMQESTQAAAAAQTTALESLCALQQIAATADDRDALLRRACESLTKTRGYSAIWAALLDPRGKVVIAAEAGLTSVFPRLLRHLKRGQLPPCGQAALAKPTEVVTDHSPESCAVCPLESLCRDRAHLAVCQAPEGTSRLLLAATLEAEASAERFAELAALAALGVASLEMRGRERRATRLLGEEQAAREALCDHLGIGLARHRLVLDRRGRPIDAQILEVNATLAEMLGCPAGDLAGQRISRALADIPPVNQEVRARMEQAALEGASERFVCQTPRGSWEVQLFGTRSREFFTSMRRARRRKAPRAATPPRAAERTPGSLPAPQRPQVLVVEDNPAARQAAAAMCAQVGCAVDVAADGRQALVRLRSRKYDLVFMDCIMPRLDGFEATRRWRAHAGESADRLPIIGLTMAASAANRERCLAVGMVDALAKPLSRPKLRAALQRWCRPTPRPADMPSG